MVADDAVTDRSSKSAWFSTAKVEPKNAGCKTLPVGKPGCLNKLTFVMTGCMDSLERDDAKKLIEKYGGRATGSVSGKTSYLIAGVDEFGEVLKGSKYKKAEGMSSCKIIDENDLFKLIQPDYDADAATQEQGDERFDFDAMESSPEPSPAKPAAPSVVQLAAGAAGEAAAAPAAKPAAAPATADSMSLWTEKYKPKSVKDLIGNQSEIQKLHQWLNGWKRALQVNNAANKAAADKKKGAKVAKSKEMKKACLVSGPPGIGKTSAATLVARELGYEVLEFNASSVRNKKALNEAILPLIGNRSIGEFYVSQNEKTKETVLIMDECDGMGSGDRGGMACLIELIKISKIPIICICNDRQHQKVSSTSSTSSASITSSASTPPPPHPSTTISLLNGVPVSALIVSVSQSQSVSVRRVWRRSDRLPHTASTFHSRDLRRDT